MGNMRQEPVVYVNGNPMCGRPPNKIGEYAELGDVTRDQVKKDEEEFLRVIEGRVKNGDGKLKYFDVNKKELEVEVKAVKTLSQVIEGVKEKFPNIVHMRIPVCNSAAPLTKDFDTICSTLQGSVVTAPVIVNFGQIIPDIYQTAHGLFRDLPLGDHKKRAKYRFASKTLMRILPGDLKEEVEGLIDKDAMTMDLYEILGHCTWGKIKT